MDTDINPVPATQKPGLGANIATGVVVVLLVGGGIWFFASVTSWIFGDGTPSALSSVAAQPEEHSDAEAYVDAQSIVTKTLKSPSTAKFPSMSQATIEHLATDSFKVSSYVDSQNGFGAMLRSDWTAIFIYTLDGNLDIYEVIVDGQVLYRKAGV